MNQEEAMRRNFRHALDRITELNSDAKAGAHGMSKREVIDAFNRGEPASTPEPRTLETFRALEREQVRIADELRDYADAPGFLPVLPVMAVQNATTRILFEQASTMVAQGTRPEQLKAVFAELEARLARNKPTP